jgi:xylan 1,4-beta-xylosidase
MVRQLILFCLVTLLLLACAKQDSNREHTPTNPNLLTADEKLERIESHDQAFLALNEKVRDPWILAAPDGYFYLTGTTAGSHWGDTIGVHLWRSIDLTNWEALGFVWDLYKDGEPSHSWHFDQPVKKPQFKNPRAVWAPEIHYLNGTFWLIHCLNISGHGLLRSSSGKTEGPYEIYPMIHNSGIDAHLYQENGQSYYQNGGENERSC